MWPTKASSRSLRAFVVLSTILVFCAPALAHKVPVERTIIAQVHADRVEFMIVYEESPGPRTEQFEAYDLDRDGRIDGKEVDLAIPELSRRALLGLEFEIVGERPALLPAEAKFRSKPGKGLSAALFLTYKLKPIGVSRTVAIRSKSRQGQPKTTVTIDTAAELFVASVDGAQASDESTAPITLGPGESLIATIRKRAK